MCLNFPKKPVTSDCLLIMSIILHWAKTVGKQLGTKITYLIKYKIKYLKCFMYLIQLGLKKKILSST